MEIGDVARKWGKLVRLESIKRKSFYDGTRYNVEIYQEVADASERTTSPLPRNAGDGQDSGSTNPREGMGAVNDDADAREREGG